MPRIHDLEVDQYLYDSLALEPEAIQEEMVRVPTDLAYWGEQQANALSVFKKAKLLHERNTAQLNMSHREKMAVDPARKKPPTVDEIEAAVKNDPSYESSALHEIECEATYMALRSRFAAICAKKDMVQSLGAQLRLEMGNDPVVRDRVRTNRLQRAGEEMGEDARGGFDF